MPFSRNNEELAAQAETLRLLSFLFDSPDPSLLSIIGNLRELYRVDRHAVQLLDGMVLRSAESKLAANLEREVKNSTAYTMSTILNCIAESESDLMVDPYLNSLRAPPERR